MSCKWCNESCPPKRRDGYCSDHCRADYCRYVEGLAEATQMKPDENSREHGGFPFDRSITTYNHCGVKYIYGGLRDMEYWDSKTWTEAAEATARTLASFRLGLDADDPYAFNKDEFLRAGIIVGRLSAMGLLAEKKSRENTSSHSPNVKNTPA